VTLEGALSGAIAYWKIEDCTRMLGTALRLSCDLPWSSAASVGRAGKQSRLTSERCMKIVSTARCRRRWHVLQTHRAAQHHFSIAGQGEEGCSRDVRLHGSQPSERGRRRLPCALPCPFLVLAMMEWQLWAANGTQGEIGGRGQSSCSGGPI